MYSLVAFREVKELQKLVEKLKVQLAGKGDSIESQEMSCEEVVDALILMNPLSIEKVREFTSRKTLQII
jgi:hypothetical protein